MDKTELKRANRIAEHRAALGKLSNDDLKKAATETGAKLEGDETREEIEFATALAAVEIEEAAAAKDAKDRLAAEDKTKREAFYATKEGKKQRAADEADARDRAIRGVHSAFIKALPNEARSSGSYDIKPDAPEAGQYPVADGSYRVSGSAWIVHFKDGKWAGANLAHARAAPDWTEIPDAPGNPVSAASPPEK